MMLRDEKGDKVDGLVRCCDERQRCKGASAQYFHFLTMSEIKGCSSQSRWTSGSSRQCKFMTLRDQRSTGLSELCCCFHNSHHTVNVQHFQLPHNVCVSGRVLKSAKRRSAPPKMSLKLGVVLAPMALSNSRHNEAEMGQEKMMWSVLTSQQHLLQK